MSRESSPLWHALREHAAHWMVGGVLLSLTGFVPEEWIAHTVHGLHIPDSVLHLWSADVDVRVVPIAIGVAVVAITLIWQRQALLRAQVPSAVAAGAPPGDAATTPKPVRRLMMQDAPAALPLPDKPSVAVLPFTNASGDPEQEYFSDGVAEDIITALSRGRALFVIARNSSFTCKARAVDVKQVARELGVRYVLEGSVRRGGDRVRVTAQLVDAESGNHLWADRYDRDLADTFAVQDEITTAVVLAIGPAIVDAEQQRAGRKQPESLGAWDACKRGLWHLARQDPVENMKARGLFQRAIELDPNLSSAYQGMVYSYIDEIRAFGMIDHTEIVATVQPLAHRAVALDPSDANAHAALGWVFETEGDHEAALDRAEQALALNANCADAYRLKGVSLVFSGQHRDGCQVLLTHLRLNPRDPGNWRAFHMIAMGRYLLGDFAGAIEAGRRAMHENPNQFQSYRWLVAALAQLGRIAEVQNVTHDVTSKFSPEWSIYIGAAGGRGCGKRTMRAWSTDSERRVGSADALAGRRAGRGSGLLQHAIIQIVCRTTLASSG